MAGNFHGPAEANSTRNRTYAHRLSGSMGVVALAPIATTTCYIGARCAAASKTLQVSYYCRSSSGTTGSRWRMSQPGTRGQCGKYTRPPKSPRFRIWGVSSSHLLLAPKLVKGAQLSKWIQMRWLDLSQSRDSESLLRCCKAGPTPPPYNLKLINATIPLSEPCFFTPAPSSLSPPNQPTTLSSPWATLPLRTPSPPPQQSSAPSAPSSGASS